MFQSKVGVDDFNRVNVELATLISAKVLSDVSLLDRVSSFALALVICEELVYVDLQSLWYLIGMLPPLMPSSLARIHFPTASFLRLHEVNNVSNFDRFGLVACFFLVLCKRTSTKYACGPIYFSQSYFLLYWT